MCGRMALLFDLPVALGLLAAMGIVTQGAIENHLVTGELSLDGRIKGTRGVLPMAVLAAKERFACMIVPAENWREAAVVKGIKVYGASHLLDIVHYLRGDSGLPSFTGTAGIETRPEVDDKLNFSDVRGQALAKRAIEITAAGGHNVVMLYTI